MPASDCVPTLRGVGTDGADDAAMLAVSQRWWDDIWRDGRLDAVDELFTEPFIRHTGTGTDQEGRVAYKGRLAEFQRVLSRVETTIDDRVVAGDRVWTRATSRGINRETGDRSVVTWLLVQRISGGQIAEHWVATFTGVDWTV
jgi:predicted SnoaL-like aldol condensation-catalyzing enzyme